MFVVIGFRHIKTKMSVKSKRHDAACNVSLQNAENVYFCRRGVVKTGNQEVTGSSLVWTKVDTNVP